MGMWLRSDTFPLGLSSIFFSLNGDKRNKSGMKAGAKWSSALDKYAATVALEHNLWFSLLGWINSGLHKHMVLTRGLIWTLTSARHSPFPGFISSILSFELEDLMLVSRRCSFDFIKIKKTLFAFGLFTKNGTPKRSRWFCRAWIQETLRSTFLNLLVSECIYRSDFLLSTTWPENKQTWI